MSQEQLQPITEDDEQEGLISNPLRLFTADKVDEQALERKLQNFYNPLQVECCGFRETPPDKAPIANEKLRLGLPFLNEFAKDAVPELLSLNDGIYQTSELEKFDTMNLHRLETRLCRDSRQEYFKANGELIINREFFDDKVSRLANISFEANPALAVYQKNAILSTRSNQNKNEPFEIELVIGQVCFTQHPLMNDEQKKFQQLRPLLENLQKYVNCPELPHLSKVIDELKGKQRRMELQGASPIMLDEVAEQIAKAEARYVKEGDVVQQEMRRVLDGWNEIKAIRKAQGSITVPWKISVKEYKSGEHTEYQIGLSTVPVTEKLEEIKPSEQARRQQMQKEKYFLRLVINNNVVSTSSKVQMSWPYFSLPVYEKFNMFVYTMPSSVKLEVVKDGIISSVIDTISLKLPGEHANTITSSERRLVSENFASNGDAVRKKKQEPSGYVGTLNYKIEWKGQAAKMPPSNITISDETESTADTSVPEEDEENMDVNDPRKVERHKKIGKKQTIQAERTSKESVLPFDGVISTRQFLLKIRSKNNNLQGKKIPLTEEAIRKRQDLMQVIDQERQANIIYESSTEHTYNPLEGVFSQQPESVKRRIKEILNKINDNKHVVSTGAVATSYKYRLVDEIVNEYTFEQMVSPIVVFFEDLFTQKRKLGPRKVFVPSKKENVSELQITLYFASAVNVPTREKANNVLTKYRSTRNEMARQVLETIGLMNGLSLFQQQPNISTQSYPYYNNPTGNMELARRGPGGYGPQFGQMNVDYNNDLLPSIQRVSTFLELHYKKNYRRTSQAEGIAPEWNESLTFPFNMKHENSSLEQMFFSTARKITINLFDLLEKSEATDTMMDIKIRKHRTFLGSMEIPLSTLISLPTISGSFKINRPLLIFGYTSVQQPILTDVDRDEERTENPAIGTYVNMDLSLSPSIDNSVAYNSDRKFFSGEQDPLFLQHANDWLEQLNLKRYIRLWLNNLDGNSTFISRFLCDIEPPPLKTAENPERVIERTARFVSLIPHKSVCRILENTEEFHMTSQQFLDAKMGDDHAILLCNYFNAIDRQLGNANYQSYVIIGKSFPEGKTMYVLRLDKTTLEFELWNPRTGEPYSYNKEEFETVCCCFTVSRGLKTNQLNKDVCPLVEVGCVVSNDNVYVNLQASANPGEISYDLNNDKLWKPFLTERSRRELFAKKPLVPYQGRPIKREFYEMSRNTHVKEIEQDVRQFICSKMSNQRKNMMRPYTFRMNNNISDLIRNEMLIELETLSNDFRLTGNDSKFYSAKQKSEWPSILEELERLKGKVKNSIEENKEFYGFPLHFTFTTVEDIWEKVNMTQIHTLEKEDVEFVVAVRTFEHPCYLTSVWVFLGILIVVD